MTGRLSWALGGRTQRNRQEPWGSGRREAGGGGGPLRRGKRCFWKQQRADGHVRPGPPGATSTHTWVLARGDPACRAGKEPVFNPRTSPQQCQEVGVSCPASAVLLNLPTRLSASSIDASREHTREAPTVRAIPRTPLGGAESGGDGEKCPRWGSRGGGCSCSLCTPRSRSLESCSCRCRNARGFLSYLLVGSVTLAAVWTLNQPPVL